MLSGLGLKAIAVLIGGLGITGAVALGIQSFKNWLAQKQERDRLENQIDIEKKRAQDFADAPAGDDDFHARMRDRIKNKPGN